jgi:uncharacterized membrane protein SpoIIM required for sporulation
MARGYPVTTGAADDSLRAWLARRVELWQQIERDQQRLARGRRHDVTDANAVVDGYRVLARDLAIARRLMPDSRVARFLEAAYLRAHALLARPAHAFFADLRMLMTEDVPATTRALRRHIFAIAALLLLSGLAGAWLIGSYPELVTLIAPESVIWAVESGDLWIEDIVSVVPAGMVSAGILVNNVTVTLFAYCVGVIFGLGTFYIIVTNGLMIGGLFAFTYRHELAGELFEFVAAHGPVELTAICLSGAAGAMVGEALVRPRGKTRAESFRGAVARTFRYLAFIIVLLTATALIEGFISSNPTFPLVSRAVIGAASLLVAVLAMTGLAYRRANGAAQTRRRSRASS